MPRLRKRRLEYEAIKARTTMRLFFCMLFWLAYAGYCAVFLHWLKTSDQVSRLYYWIFVIFAIGNIAVPAWVVETISHAPLARTFVSRMVFAVLNFALTVGAV